MAPSGLPTLIHVYSLASLAVAAIFLYQALITYISYHSYKLSYAKYLIWLCAIGSASCFFNFLFPLLEEPHAKYMNTHLIFVGNYAANLVYVRLMKSYFNRNSRALIFSERILSVSLVVLVGLTIAAALGYPSFLLHKEPLRTNSSYILSLQNPFSVSPMAQAFIAPAFLGVVHHYVFFFRHLWLHRRQEPLLLAGLGINFLIVLNDVSLVTESFAYAFPLISFSYFAETIRITSVIQQRSAIKLNELEGEVIQMAQVAELGFLAGNISHDIRNPLALVSGSSERLRRHLSTQLPEDLTWLALTDKIDRACMRMDKIIESYLFLLHKDSGEHKAQAVNWQDAVTEAVSLCERRTASIPNLQLTVDAASPLVMAGHDTQLIMILVNLINNACDAIAHLPAPWIRIEATERGKAFEIRITDSGPGIAADILEHIFEKRFTTKSRGKGSGLGLDFVRRVVIAHGGSIAVDTSHANTSFVMRFPNAAFA